MVSWNCVSVRTSLPHTQIQTTTPTDGSNSGGRTKRPDDDEKRLSYDGSNLDASTKRHTGQLEHTHMSTESPGDRSSSYAGLGRTFRRDQVSVRETSRIIPITNQRV